jgi:UPF0755 protein
MKKLLLLVIVIAVIAGGAYFWWQNALSPVDTKKKESKMFVIPKGSGIRAIANDLKEQGLIRDDVVFFLYVRKNGIDKKIQAGDFKLSPSMSSQQIAKALTMASKDVWITIPEGKRAEEVAEILKESIPTYDDTWVARLQEHEGFLFPDTYLIPRDATIDQIITLLTTTFDQKYSTITNNTNLSKAEIATLASLIEREAITNEEKPMISGIIHNRLDEGMPLQIDATIQYAKGRPGNWWEIVEASEYQSVKSLYNTYLRQGLPPGPIGNAGLEAITAAANPSDTEYFYYLHDKNQNIRYAKTNEEHINNIEQYGL